MPAFSLVASRPFDRITRISCMIFIFAGDCNAVTCVYIFIITSMNTKSSQVKMTSNRRSHELEHGLGHCVSCEHYRLNATAMIDV